MAVEPDQAEEFLRSQEIISLTNFIIASSGLSAKVSTLDEVCLVCSKTSLMIAAIEVLLNRRLPGIIRKAAIDEERVYNINSVVKSLSRLLGLELTHISALRIIEGSMPDIVDLIEIISTLLRNKNKTDDLKEDIDQSHSDGRVKVDPYPESQQSPELGGASSHLHTSQAYTSQQHTSQSYISQSYTSQPYTSFLDHIASGYSEREPEAASTGIYPNTLSPVPETRWCDNAPNNTVDEEVSLGASWRDSIPHNAVDKEVSFGSIIGQQHKDQMKEREDSGATILQQVSLQSSRPHYSLQQQKQLDGEAEFVSDQNPHATSRKKGGTKIQKSTPGRGKCEPVSRQTTDLRRRSASAAKQGQINLSGQVDASTSVDGSRVTWVRPKGGIQLEPTMAAKLKHLQSLAMEDQVVVISNKRQKETKAIDKARAMSLYRIAMRQQLAAMHREEALMITIKGATQRNETHKMRAKELRIQRLLESYVSAERSRQKQRALHQELVIRQAFMQAIQDEKEWLLAQRGYARAKVIERHKVQELRRGKSLQTASAALSKVSCAPPRPHPPEDDRDQQRSEEAILTEILDRMASKSKVVAERALGMPNPKATELITKELRHILRFS